MVKPLGPYAIQIPRSPGQFSYDFVIWMMVRGELIMMLMTVMVNDMMNMTMKNNNNKSQVHPKAQVVHKGSNPHVDSYSAFFDNQKLSKTCLEELIRKDIILQCWLSRGLKSRHYYETHFRKEEVTDLYICGIATDVCVGR